MIRKPGEPTAAYMQRQRVAVMRFMDTADKSSALRIRRATGLGVHACGLVMDDLRRAGFVTQRPSGTWQITAEGKTAVRGQIERDGDDTAGTPEHNRRVD